MKLPFAHLFSEKKRITKDLVNTSEEFGGAGTKKLGGFIQEEYNSDLQGLNGVQKYEEMRSSDASIGAVLLAAELPIRATKWRINPGRTNGEITPQDEEIAEFISNCLFDYLEDGSFDDFLRQSLTMLPFGFSVFEKVYKIKGDKIVLRKLAQRLQASIYKWETEDKQAGITQKLFWDDSKKQDTVSIPKQYLVIFSFRREGDNYEGRSILRTAYKHWYIKDSLYKIDAVKHERLGIGIPVITLPKGASDDDKKEAETILENLRGTEQTYVVLPSPDWKIEFMDLKGGAAADASKSIAHHDRQISKSILAQFIDLGAESSGGSYALSEDQSSLFTLGLTAIANQFSEVVNKQIIEELVRLNFNLSENQTFPYLDFAKIGDIDYEKLANTISSLVGVSALSVDEDLENHLREVLDLPEKVQVETQEDELNPQEEMDGEPSVEDLENELATLEAYEIESFVNSSLFADISYEEALEFKFLDSETKAKISQGLIEYWKRKGKKTTQEVKDQKGTSETAKKETMDQLSQTRGEYKAKVSEIRNKINALKGTKASKAQIKTLRNEINALKKEKDLKVNELNSVKALQTMDIKAARTELKRRKEMLKEFIKQVNERVKNDIISADTAKKEITTQISKNAEEIKDFSEAMRSEIKSLREKMKGLKRGSTEYKKLQKQIEDKTQVKNETLKQIREENETLRSERSGIIEEKRQTREDKKEVIEKAKAQFSEKVLEFSEDTKVEARVAKKIIDYLEELAEGNPVGISDVDVVLNNLKHELRMKISMASLLNKASDEEIQAVIYELIDNRKRWEREYPEATLRQYGFNDAEEAKYFKESKEIFNFLDIINTQNGK